MQTFIDKLNILKCSLILDGYEIDDACVKMVDLFIRDEQIEIQKASTAENLIPIIKNEIEKYLVQFDHGDNSKDVIQKMMDYYIKLKYFDRLYNNLNNKENEL